MMETIEDALISAVKYGVTEGSGFPSHVVINLNDIYIYIDGKRIEKPDYTDIYDSEYDHIISRAFLGGGKYIKFDATLSDTDFYPDTQCCYTMTVVMAVL